MRDISKYSDNIFERLKRVDETNREYWLARDLQVALVYSTWQKFVPVIEKAKQSCKTSGEVIHNHFNRVGNLVEVGSGAYREVEDIKLSRYACYLIVQNGDPSKPMIALGQTYFAVKTRQQELQEQFEKLTEDQKRIGIRAELKEHNKALVDAAKDAGVETTLDYALFQDEGYKGLYGGLTARTIHFRKGLKKSQKILDHMSSEELAANLFRATQTESKLRREKIKGKLKANHAHYAVGSKVRQTIRELGGTMPEDLPTPDKSIQQIQREQEKKLTD